jgi:collagenase-like PrtC family protease
MKNKDRVVEVAAKAFKVSGQYKSVLEAARAIAQYRSESEAAYKVYLESEGQVSQEAYKDAALAVQRTNVAYKAYKAFLVAELSAARAS